MLEGLQMKIVCVAWGSLLWNLKGFPSDGEWRGGGPLVPLEFARHSDGEIVSLVVLETGPLQPTFWAPVAADSLEDAREALREREDIRTNALEWIGSVPRPNGLDYAQSHAFAVWLEHNGADAVVWTALPAKSQGINGRMPSVDEALSFLQSLEGESRQRAEDYVRQTPAVVLTPFRKRFADELGWTPKSAQ